MLRPQTCYMFYRYMITRHTVESHTTTDHCPGISTRCYGTRPRYSTFKTETIQKTSRDRDIQNQDYIPVISYIEPIDGGIIYRCPDCSKTLALYKSCIYLLTKETSHVTNYPSFQQPITSISERVIEIVQNSQKFLQFARCVIYNTQLVTDT